MYGVFAVNYGAGPEKRHLGPGETRGSITPSETAEPEKNRLFMWPGTNEASWRLSDSGGLERQPELDQGEPSVKVARPVSFWMY
jgi:hypothetical protein